MNTSTDQALRSLQYVPATETSAPTLAVLDQLVLPAQKVYLPVPDIATTFSVIRNMNIRGAPLIAIVACLGLAVDLHTEQSQRELLELPNEGAAVYAYLLRKVEVLTTSRPTAVNLFNAMNELKALLEALSKDAAVLEPKSTMVQAVTTFAEKLYQQDLQDCQNLGQHGAAAILRRTAKKVPVTVMTICNTGSLATSGYGTALGVVRALHAQGRLAQVVALETRPYNQGSRLTCFEIMQDELPGMLITDNMAAALLATQTVDAVVVGADRVCANGDTANKIGTYMLAVLCAAHNVPFFVAAPTTTLDVQLASGKAIVIEERSPQELLATSSAPENMPVWNPAFDVTPAKYISGGIITEKGVIAPKVDRTIDVASFVSGGTDDTIAPVANKALQIPVDYTEMNTETLPAYLAQHADEAMKVLGTTEAADLVAAEMGDGNLNLVFIVTNRHDNKKQVIVKQALPYVRCVGESWPMTLERAYYEYKALSIEKAACARNVPSIYFFSKANGLICMEYLAPPIIILRKGLIQGIKYPTMAADMGRFCASTLFRTSGFSLTPTQLRQQVEFWSTNVEMCSLTEQVIFTEPYVTAANNRWTTPQLDNDKRDIENNEALKLAAARYKHKFITETQALVHGDLHSGSVMCAPMPGATYVIDPEFAFYGPMAFDTGAFVGNLFLAYVAQPGHANAADYADWILQQIDTFWTVFATEFGNLWNNPATHLGYWYGRNALSADNMAAAQTDFMATLLSDTLGFAGMKMLRRIVGIAHVEDLESIADVNVRATCEQHGLRIARRFITAADKDIPSMAAAIELARACK